MFNDATPAPSQPSPLQPVPGPTAPSAIPQPPAPPAAPIAPPPAPASRSKKGLVIGILALVLLLGLGGGAFAYYQQALSSPERVMPKMFEAMEATTSFSYDAVAEVTGVGTDKDGEELTFEGEAAAIGAVDADTTTGEFSLSGAKKGDESITFGAEYRQDGEQAYVKLLSLPPMGLDDFEEAFDDLESVITNRWIAIGKDQMRNMLGDELVDKLDELKAEIEPTDDELESAKQAMIDIVLAGVEITERLESETVNGIPTYHYAYAIDKEATVAELERVRSEQENFISEKNFTEFSEALEGMDEITGEIWIGKKDYRIYQLTAKTNYEKTPDEGELDGGKITADISVNLTDYNDEVTVEVPEESVSMLDLMGELFEAMSVKASERESDEDGDGLKLREEERYGTDSTNPDTDGDGYLDGDEVEGGYNPNGEGILEETFGTLKAEDILGDDFGDTTPLGE